MFILSTRRSTRPKVDQSLSEFSRFSLLSSFYHRVRDRYGRETKMALTNIQKVLIRVPIVYTSKRHITSKVLQSTLGPRPLKPAPFPYKEKDYTLLRSVFDKTTHRFDENTKLIVIEGPVGVGKCPL